MQTRDAAARLAGIEALRGVAATTVVFSHAARHVNAFSPTPELITFFQAGHAGVDLFFTISGFIILFVHRGDIGRPDRLPHYLSRRFSRIMPLYWVGLGLAIAMTLAGRHAPPDVTTLLWAVALLPTVGEPLLGIAWTLQYELVFYAVFALLIVNRAVGLALLMAWLAWIAAALCGFDAPGIPSALHGHYALEFFMGMAAAQWLHRGPVPMPRLVAGAGLLLFIATLVLESLGILNGFGSAARFPYGLSAALLILGTAATERSGWLVVPGWLRMLGGASYSIYLFQFVFIGTVWQAMLAMGMERLMPLSVVFAILSGVAVAGGIMMARWVERPLLRAMRGGWRGMIPGRA